MNKDELKEYNNAIRQMLQHEDNIRNQRTTWFLVIQGLLINGILLVLTNKDLELKLKLTAVAILLLIGLLISISFFYAADLSHKAYTRGKRYWNDIIKHNSKDFPPICLLADNTLDLGYRKKKILLPYYFLPLFFTLIEAIIFSYIFINIDILPTLITKLLLLIIISLLLSIIIFIILYSTD